MKNKLKGTCQNCRRLFTKNNSCPSVRKRGYGFCRVCFKNYWAAWRTKNKEKILGIQRRYTARNIKKIRKKHKEYYRLNKSKILKNTARSYRENKERCLRLGKLNNEKPQTKHRMLLRKMRKEKISILDPLRSFNFYFEFIKDNQCHYCGGPLNKTGHNLDRMNNQEKHTIQNVVPCCWGCNKLKRNEISYEEMMLLSPVLNLIRQRRNKIQ